LPGGFGRFTVTTPLVRRARVDDASAFARIWLDMCRYYADLARDNFRIPSGEGLAEWFEGLLTPPGSEDEIKLACELDDLVVGFLDGELIGPAEDAERQMVIAMSLRRLSIGALAVERSSWRRGCGTTLLEAAEEWGRERGAEAVTLVTYERSPVSVPFYERGMGYSRGGLSFHKDL